jgi:putative NADPH-quinone reductase
MKISVILAHPNLQKESFNHAIARTAVDILEQTNHTVSYHDLIRKNLIQSSLLQK